MAPSTPTPPASASDPADADPEPAEDPAAVSMTVSYTFPENAGFANPAHSDATPCVVRRERAGQVSVSWLGADAGHECAVNEHTPSARSPATRPRS